MWDFLKFVAGCAVQCIIAGAVISAGVYILLKLIGLELGIQ